MIGFGKLSWVNMLAPISHRVPGKKKNRSFDYPGKAWRAFEELKNET